MAIKETDLIERLLNNRLVTSATTFDIELQINCLILIIDFHLYL
jgi:hypothetical protein